MANDFLDILTPTIIGEWSLQYLRTRSAMLGRVYVETYMQENIEGGGDQIIIPKPDGAPAAPVAVTPGATNAFASLTNLTVDGITLNFPNHYGHKVSANQLESRIAKGNFDLVMKMNWGRLLDGIAIKVDKTVTGLYSGLSRSIGTGGSALTDVTVRGGIEGLTDTNVLINPLDVTLITTNHGYWSELMGIDRYTLALQRGDPDALIKGELNNLYGVHFDFSPNIIKTAAGSPSVTTAHNLIFDKLAFMLGFYKFEPIMKYAPAGIAGVEESYVTDSVTGLTLRVLKYFDTNSLTWFWSIDVKWGAVVYDDSRAIEIKS